MRESTIERYLCKRVKEHLGIPYKFTSPGRRGVPDRLCLFGQCRLFFVECKATGKKPTRAQKSEIKILRKMGFTVYVVDSYEQVDAIEWPYAGID